MAAGSLVLRDIHQPPAPPWWPPAPGWWIVAGVLLLAIALWAWWAARRRRRHRRLAALFDDTVDAAGPAPAQVAAMSELLRRAARRHHPAADTLEGDAWLALLDRADGRRGGRRHAVPARFADGPGRLLLEGGYRRDLDPVEVAQLRPLARARFLDWMTRR